MVAYARVYLAGELDLMSFYYAIAEASIAVHRYGPGPDSQVAQIAREWCFMADRFRNEMGIAPDPLTEDDFRGWLTNQL